MPSDPAPTRPGSPAAALADHAARHPQRPFLFWPEGLDWRWMAFVEAAAEVERLRGGRPARRAEESAVPAAMVEVLERIAAGEARGGAAAVAAGPERIVEGAAAGGAAAARPRGAGGPAAATGAPAAPIAEASGSAAPAAGPGGRESDAPAGGLAGGPAPGPGGEARREIVILAPPFGDEGERDLLAWAVVTGAAVVVEPSRGALVATAAWVRPTVFRGTAAEVAALAREAAAAERSGFAGWWRRVRRRLGGDPPPPRPFGRLHTILVADAPAEACDAAFWHARGTRLLAEPPVTAPSPHAGTAE